MTNFRPTSLSPEALEAWDEAEANIEASMQRIRELTAPLRRSKPPNLAEQAMEAQQRVWTNGRTHADWELIRAALERLQELEKLGEPLPTTDDD